MSLRPPRSVAVLLLAASVACDDTPGDPAPRDVTPPAVTAELVILGGDRYAVAGQATDDRGIVALQWGRVELVNGAPGPDTVRRAVDVPLGGGRLVSFRFDVPPPASGTHQLFVSARDSAGNAATTPLGPISYGPPRPVVSVSTAPAGDTLWQRGVEVSVSLAGDALMRQVRVYVDSGLPTETVSIFELARFTAGVSTAVGLPVPLPGPGSHVITVVASGTSTGRDGSARVTRTVAIPDAPHAVTPLPDLGGTADALGISSRGDVAGWVAAPGGRRRAAVWRERGARLDTLAVPGTDTIDVTAARVNAAGDVLLKLGFRNALAARRGVVVRRADGALLTVGPLKYLTIYPGQDFDICCDLAADLTDARVALGTSIDDFFYYRSALLDVASGRLIDSSQARLVALNERGKAAGTTSGGYSMMARYLVTVGFAAPAIPVGVVPRVCDTIARRWNTLVPIDLDDDENLLATWCGNPAYLPPSGAGVWLERVFGQISTVRMARQGGWIASLDTAGTLHVWRSGTRGPLRVRVPGDGWRFDALGGVNARGEIAAHGVHAATGRRAALLLTPAR